MTEELKIDPDPEATLDEIVRAAHVLGLRVEFQLIPRDPLKRLVYETIRAHKEGKRPVRRWP